MSLIGQSFYLAFGANILFSWGILPGLSRDGGRRGLAGTLELGAMTLAAAIGSLLNALAFRWLLEPLGLESLVPFVFAGTLLLALWALGFSKGGRKAGDGPGIRPGENPEWIIYMPAVLFACVLSAAGFDGSAAFLMLSGASAAFGFIVASVFLEDILARQELEPTPRPFAGLPARLLSAGLMALAFSGVDAAFFGRIFPR